MTVDGLTLGDSAVDRPGPDRPPGEPGAVSGPFLTVAEVARRMRVSKMTVYRLVHSGELPANRFGRTFRVQRGAVEELIEAARYRAG
jgi:excisionase family DNA binding protein